MIEQEKVTIELRDACQILARHLYESAQVSSIFVELSEGERRSWLKVILDKTHQEFVELGYLKEKAVEETFQTQYVLDYESTERDFVDGRISEEQYINWCYSGRFEGLDVLVRTHQRQFGEPEVGFVASDKLKTGRLALLKAQEAHLKLHIDNPEMPKDVRKQHGPIRDQYISDILACGYDTVDEFEFISGALP